MACLYVSTKMHDTLKKPRDILMVSYTIRFPELAARSKVQGGDIEIDPAVCGLFSWTKELADASLRHWNKTASIYLVSSVLSLRPYASISQSACLSPMSSR